MTSALLLPLLLATPPLSIAERIEGVQAVEKSRYAFVIGASRPFDEVYPRTVFEARVRREVAEERVLSSQFGIQVTPTLLSAEYDRIEKETRAPDQWEAVKKSLGNSRRRIEEVFCEPLLVERLLRARFAFDEAIHAVEHQKVRIAREAFLAGNTPIGAKLLHLSRRKDASPCTDEILAKVRADAIGVGAPRPSGIDLKADLVISPDRELMNVLEKELKESGDVTTILEERDLFSVYRLVGADPGEWLVEAVQIPKRGFDRWFEAAQEPTRRPD